MRHRLSIGLVFLVAIAAQCTSSVARRGPEVSPVNRAQATPVKQVQGAQATFKLNPPQDGDSELSGYVRYGSSPAKGVVLSIGNFSVTSDGNGYYKLGYLRPGTKTVWVTPPGRQARSFSVQVGPRPTQKDFVVDW